MARPRNSANRAGSRLSATPALPGFDAVMNSDGPIEKAVAAAAPDASPLDVAFGKLMVRLDGSENAALQSAAEHASAWRAAGHICIPLNKITKETAALEQTLRATKVTGAPGDWKPLILDTTGRLYLHRYWRYERHLALAIRARTSAHTALPCSQAEVAKLLDRYFLAASDDQRRAAERAIQSSFCVITGGPGTGKTHTIARLIALLAEIAPIGSPSPRVALAAPTGKAASRMTESIRHALGELPTDARRSEALTIEGQTLHRLLGITPGSPMPRFDERNPLPIDSLILDEASMVDLATMSKVFAATPLHARIVLLGDKDQLASVEAGSVLADICLAAEEAGESPLGQCVSQLRRSYRFTPGSGIERLSTAINGGAADEAIALLKDPPAGIEAMPLPAAASFEFHIAERASTYFRSVLEMPEPRLALNALGAFRILCAVRRGPYGVENLNRLVEKALASRKIATPGARHYHGRPILVLRNDYGLRLFNGDIGLLLHDPEAGGDLRAFFIGQDGALRRLLPARLPEHETAWAITVHKSQGSEFNRVLLIVPDRDSPLLTRELLYTGVTRARETAEIWSDEATLRAAISRRTERHSGLRDALLSDSLST